MIRNQIKKENYIEKDESSNGEYVANLISKLKDFDSDEDEDDPEAKIDEQDVADTIDMIDNTKINCATGGIADNAVNDGLKLIDIDPKKLYDQSAYKSATPPSEQIIEDPVKVENVEIKPTEAILSLSQKKYLASLDHLPETLAGNLRKSKYFLAHPTVLKKSKDNGDKSFQEDSNLMPGWKVKYYTRLHQEGGRSDKVYLSPENMQIRSSFGLFEYMRCSEQYTDSQMKSVTSIKNFCKTNIKKYK